MMTRERGCSCCGRSNCSCGGGHGSASSVSSLFTDLTSLFSDSARLSIDLLRTLTGGVSLPSMFSMPSHGKASHGCSCEIPPACWLPVEAGRAQTAACPGATATLRIRVENCGMTARTIAIDVAGAPKDVTVSPASLNVGPLESGTTLVSFEVSPDAAEHTEYPFLIWIRGCKSYVVRWTVVAGDGDCHCRTINIEDCPDTVHHWYDHFYCDHPCQH